MGLGLSPTGRRPALTQLHTVMRSTSCMGHISHISALQALPTVPLLSRVLQLPSLGVQTRQWGAGGCFSSKTLCFAVLRRLSC